MMSPMLSIYNEIRHAILACKKSRYQRWQETGISQDHLCQFIVRAKGLSVAKLDKLANALVLSIATRPKKSQAIFLIKTKPATGKGH